jgi:cation diffusion facilitator CzcD-associated flavoprotein CzcO
MPASSVEHWDVLIIGAGLSGIDAAYRISSGALHRRYAILEARDAMGGTWDLFRYPGVRSDSDMTTLGFPFRPWRGDKAIADGSTILDYIVETARACGIDEHVRFGHRATSASWTSAQACWTVEVETAAGPLAMTATFLFVCTGYYDYAAAYTPVWNGMSDFSGRIVQPQFWPADLPYRDKRVVVIGSGATAVTLVPALAREATHVTMLQRSPSYILSRPARDAVADRLVRFLPGGMAHALVRWKNIALGSATFWLARHRPDFLRGLIRKGLRHHLGPDYDIDRHFSPRYQPWDQRLCVVPDADLFNSLNSGRAAMVTDEIDHLTSAGLVLKSGTQLPADIIVMATGLSIKLMGGMTLSVDGVRVPLAERLVYKGAMVEGVPNLAFAFGYTNASWTLKCDLTARFVRRLLDYFARHDVVCATPLPSTPELEREPLLDFSSGYILRGAALLPRQGRKMPWRAPQNYALDLWSFYTHPLDDGTLRFGGGVAPLRRTA